MPRCSRGRWALVPIGTLLVLGAVSSVRADHGASAQHHSEPLALLSGRLDGDADASRTRGAHEQLHVSTAHAPDEDAARDERSSGGLVHRVAQGETLSAIAAHYGIAMQQILDLNPELNPDKIREGQNLAIGTERRSVRYTVQPHDTLSRIAKDNEVTLLELQRWNPKLDPDHIRAGQELAVYPKKPASLSESVGTPANGQLIHPRMLPPGPGYSVRAPERSYATDETIRGIVEAFQHLLKIDPSAPRIWVHDLSLRRGGPMTEHRSHQSGRDADIAYPQKHCDGVCDFRRLAPSDLDPARTFALLKFWLEHDMLEAVFVDYRLQAPLYQYARAQGASAEQLHRWFQYPNGPGYPLGVIRHYPKHDDHMHVRFTCHSSDPECKSYRPLLARTAQR